MRSRIAGTGRYLPARVLANDDLAESVATSDEWIRTRTGIRARHVADDAETTSDLALAASREALAAAGLDPADVDLIVVATTTPDMIFPSTACILQAKLGTKGWARVRRPGRLLGLRLCAHARRPDGRHRRRAQCAVVGAEIYSRILDWNDRGTCVLFGDGAGAVVLVPALEPGILASCLHADGAHAPTLCVPGQVRKGAIAARRTCTWTAGTCSASR